MRRSKRIASQKRNREEEDEPLDLSKEKEKTADKKKRSNEETNDTSDDTNRCSICLDTVDNSIVKSLPCAHVFHETCINEWLKRSKICPICRWPSTVETNDSPHVGEAGSRETFEDESNGSSGSGFNNDFELDDWSSDPGLVEVEDESGSEESFDESESEESLDESESEESRDESESGESRNEFESEESRDEFESDGYSDMECYLM